MTPQTSASATDLGIQSVLHILWLILKCNLAYSSLQIKQFVITTVSSTPYSRPL